jgi:hypothetical protein
MGMKYMIYGFNYPYGGYYIASKQTKWLLVAMFWVAVFCMKYDGVDVQKRGA